MFDDMWCFVMIFIVWCWIAGCFWCLFAFLFPQANSYLMPPICYCLILFEPYLTFNKMEVMVHDGSNCKIKVNTSRDVRMLIDCVFTGWFFKTNIHFPCLIQQCLCHFLRQSSVLVWQPRRRVVEIVLPCRAPCRVQTVPQGYAQCFLGDPCCIVIDRMTGWMCLKSLKAKRPGCLCMIHSWDDCVRMLILWHKQSRHSRDFLWIMAHGARGCISSGVFTSNALDLIL